MDEWNNNDTGKHWNDGTVWRYHRSEGSDDDAILSFSPFDGSLCSYNVSKSVFKWLFKDGAQVSYDANNHNYAVTLPDGATYSVTLNGATIAVDANGNITISSLNGAVTLNAAGGVLTLEDLAFAVNTLDTIINTFNAHVHLNGGGTGLSGVPSVPMV